MTDWLTLTLYYFKDEKIKDKDTCISPKDILILAGGILWSGKKVSPEWLKRFCPGFKSNLTL